MTEYIGYAASALVLKSYLMKDMTYLRVVNTVGCLVFIIYGVFIASIPVVITNSAIVLVNLYYLFAAKNKD